MAMRCTGVTGSRCLGERAVVGRYEARASDLGCGRVGRDRGTGSWMGLSKAEVET